MELSRQIRGKGSRIIDYRKSRAIMDGLPGFQPKLNKDILSFSQPVRRAFKRANERVHSDAGACRSRFVFKGIFQAPKP
jgi:hypothetical protein